MKKRIKCFLLCIVLVLPIMLTSCSLKSCEFEPEDRSNKQTDYFVYNYIEEIGASRVCIKETAHYVVILELTESGKQQERLIIPEYIDGLPVGQIGMDLNQVVAIKRCRIDYGLYEKLYLPSGILDTIEAVCEKNFLIGLHDFDYLSQFNKTAFYLSELLYHEYMAAQEEERNNIKIANVTYISNGETFFIDDYDEGELISLPPPVPECEELTFEGWYKEPELINKWDFEFDTVHLEEERTLKLYARFI